MRIRSITPKRDDFNIGLFIRQYNRWLRIHNMSTVRRISTRQGTIILGY